MTPRAGKGTGWKGGAGPPGGGDPAALFEASLDLIRRVVRSVATRWGLDFQEMEDLQQEVCLKLIERDYEVLRTFQGRCKLETYLVTVVQTTFMDYQDRRSGKWRPSARALRFGPLAVDLERLVYREGRSLDEARAILSAKHGRPIHRDELSALLAKLPVRPPRRTVGPDGADDVPDPASDPERQVHDRERGEAARRAWALLAEALDRLAPQERLALKLRSEGIKVSEMAVLLAREQRPLYRAIERTLAKTRAYLESRGLTKADVDDLLDGPEVDPGEPGRKR